MSFQGSSFFAVALLGPGLMLAPAAGAQGVSEQAVPPAGEFAPTPAQTPALAPRSGLWQTVEAEYRRPSEAPDSNPHRLTEAQRQVLRDQVRRASPQAGNPQLTPVVSRP
ncbi:hypothetical protein FVQ98_15105 [Ottowia sp. GY511]|uniref:DUF4148 domain-containing protein n=1 Tax=Ottowia flava TaxID=2675430 RepID=A0ABW4KWN4_9BURK|nr:hypothetical protein [Ottowia sp. GY511]TXK26294.1 hypothetical protein FVQ98_15105 [Ottowia sp. GY511]